MPAMVTAPSGSPAVRASRLPQGGVPIRTDDQGREDSGLAFRLRPKHGSNAPVPALRAWFGVIERGFYLFAITWCAVFAVACAAGVR